MTFSNSFAVTQDRPTQLNGWFISLSSQGAKVKLTDGRVLIDDKFQSSRLLFGTPVRCAPFCEDRGVVLGRIVYASQLSDVPPSDDRPLAILDGSNLASPFGVDPDYSLVWTMAWSFDYAGWQPVIVDDPGSDRFFLTVNYVSASALTRIKCRPYSSRWRRLVVDWGSLDNNADRTGLLYLRDSLHRHREARFVTFDQFRDDALVRMFPELDDDDFLSRIVAPHIEDDTISLSGLGIPPMRIPHPLFQPSQRDFSSYF